MSKSRKNSKEDSNAPTSSVGNINLNNSSTTPSNGLQTPRTRRGPKSKFSFEALTKQLQQSIQEQKNQQQEQPQQQQADTASQTQQTADSIMGSPPKLENLATPRSRNNSIVPDTTSLPSMHKRHKSIGKEPQHVQQQRKSIQTTTQTTTQQQKQNGTASTTNTQNEETQKQQPASPTVTNESRKSKRYSVSKCSRNWRVQLKILQKKEEETRGQVENADWKQVLCVKRVLDNLNA